MKILIKSFLVCFLSTSALFAADNEDTYIFEAKGEFAKELETLIQKHSKDENVEINVYKKGANVKGVKTKRSFEADKERGKKLYAQQCASCHGEDGNKHAYTVSRRLSKLKADQIYWGVVSYSTDTSFGGNFKTVMRAISDRTSKDDLGYIITYLTGDDTYLYGKTSLPSQNTDIRTTPSEQGSYLE